MKFSYGIASWTRNKPNAASSRTHQPCRWHDRRREHGDAAVEALVEAGFDRNSIDVLNGEEDLSRLDPKGTEHGVLERLQRASGSRSCRTMSLLFTPQ
jgi:hypothetical protein